MENHSSKQNFCNVCKLLGKCIALIFLVEGRRWGKKNYWMVSAQLSLAKNNKRKEREETECRQSKGKKNEKQWKKKGTTATKKQSIVQILCWNDITSLSKAFIQIGIISDQVLILDIHGTIVIMSIDIFPVFISTGRTFGEEKLLSWSVQHTVKALLYLCIFLPSKNHQHLNQMTTETHKLVKT